MRHHILCVAVSLIRSRNQLICSNLLLYCPVFVGCGQGLKPGSENEENRSVATLGLSRLREWGKQISGHLGIVCHANIMSLQA